MGMFVCRCFTSIVEKKLIWTRDVLFFNEMFSIFNEGWVLIMLLIMGLGSNLDVGLGLEPKGTGKGTRPPRPLPTPDAPFDNHPGPLDELASSPRWSIAYQHCVGSGQTVGKLCKLSVRNLTLNEPF